MANKKTTNSKRFDFLPNKQNKYSIRKFTVGTASILVGATLIFGAHNDAQAEELDKTTTEEAAATEEEAPLDETTATEEATSATEETNVDAEGTATEEATTEEAATEEADTAAEQPAEEVVTEEAEATAEQPAEEVATEEAEATAEQPAEEVATEEADTTVEQPAEETTTAEPVTTTEQPVEVPATDIATVKDQASAADYLVAEKNISTEEANKIASNLNANLSEVTPEALQQAIVDYLANEQNKYNVDGTLAAVREETALTNEDVVNETPVSGSAFRIATRAAAAPTGTSTRAFDSELQKEAQKGAIYAPGEKGQKQSYEGKAWVYRGGNINNFNEKEPLANAKIYLQWVNGKGFVSPVFYTTTNPDGSYVFDLSQKLVDPTGQEHEFKLAGDGDFAVRTWVENPDPEKYNVIKHGDQKYGFHTRLSRTNESWDFTAGVNRIVNGQVLVQEKPQENDWLMKPEADWTTAPTSDGVWPKDGAYGKVAGNVWYETGDPSGSDSRAWKKDSWDVNATGVKVVASYVNDEVTRQFDAWKEANKGYTVEDFKAAQQDIVTKYQAENGVGSHIAETVVGTVESDGSYYIPFKGLYGVDPYKQNSGAKISHKVTDEEYGTLVRDEDAGNSSLLQWNGTIGQKHRHINSDYMYITAMIDDYAIWSNNYQNNMFTSASTGADIFDAKMLAAANGSNQNFIALAPQPMHDVLVYDSVENYAIPGDTVESKSGGLLPSREYQIQWFKDGVAVGDPVTKVSNVDGTIGSVPITVPADLDKNATYTSAIFHPNEKTTDLSDALAVDSFTAVVDQNIIHEPAYTPTEATAGEETSVTPTFTTKDGEPVANGDVPLATENAFKLDPNATDIPEGVEVDPTTGAVTITPTNDQVGQEITVPVVVTYEDGTTDTVEAKFTVTAPTPDADKYDPKAIPEVVEKGGEVNLLDNVDPAELPLGVEIKDVTPEGTIDTNTPGEYTGKVEITYPDGSKDMLDVPVTVKPSQADENDPTVTPEVVDKGQDVDLTDNVDLTKLPDGTTVTDVTPDGIIDTNTPGEYTGKVEVTYPDGSKETVDVPVVVNPSLADEITPKVTPEVVEQGGDVDLTDNVETRLPEGSTVTDVTPAGTIDTNTPGDYTGKVEITYPDGSKETVDVPVTVKEKLTDADQNDPTVTPEVVEKGGDVDLTDNVDLTGLPDGTTVTDVTPTGTIDTNTPGDYTGKVEVTYPDGSKDTVDVPVTVKDEAKTQADENDPTVTPEVVEKGGDVDLTDNVDLTGLPEGTTVTDVTPTGTIDTNTPGDYTGKVEVTYPDGSKETVDVPVTVKEKLTDADQNDPTVTPEEVEKGGDVDLTDNVDLTDLPDGTEVKDVTPAGTIDTDTPGDYTGVVEVVYPDGSKDTVEVPVTVKEEPKTQADENDPTVTPEVVEKGGDVDLTDNVDLTELPDGTTVTDVTPGGTIDTNTPGDYTGKVEITYPDGSKDTVDVPVTVKEKLTDADQNDPTVTPEEVEKGGDVDLTDNVDLTELPDGTTVTDVTPAGTIDTDTPGDYTGVVEVVYPDGSKDTVEVPVKVQDTIAPDAPTVTNPQPGDKVITGTAEPNGTVDVTLPNGDVITDVPVDADGNYTVDVPEGVELKEGDKVTVVAKDDSGNVSDPTEGTVTDTIAPDAPTVTNPQPGDKVITGTGEPNGTVDVTLPNGDVITDVPVDADGNYTVDVPEGVELKEGDKVTVVAKDGNGNTSTPTEGTVTDTIAPDAPTVTNPQPGDKVITGTAEPNGTVDVTLPNGDVITDVPVDENGNWKVDVPEGVELKEGDKVTVVAKDGNGNTSTPTEGTVTDTIAPDAPTITNPQPGDKVITGTGEPNGTVDVTLPNGDVIKDVPVDENGNWKVDVPEGVELKEGDKVTVVAKDGNGNTSTPTEGTVTDTIAPDAPTVNPVKPGDKVVTGKGEPGSTITVKFPDGKEGTATVDKDGNWTVNVPDGTEIKPGDELDVTATDEAGNKSDVTKVKVPDTEKDTVAPDAPTVNPVNPGDTTVTGKGEPGSTITVKFPDGKEGTATVDKDGNWTVKVPDGTVIKAGDKLIVTATDEAGNTSEATVVIVDGKDNGMTGMDQGDKAEGMDNMNNASNTDNAMKDDMKASKDMNNKGKEMKELPDTGNESTNAPLFGSLIAALGSLFLFGRRRKEKEEK